MSDMQYNEITERFSEGLKIAADRCKELKKLTGNALWAKVGDSLTELRLRGESAYRSASISKFELEAGLDKHSKLWATDSK